MITKEEYQEYLGIEAPSNFDRLLYLSKMELSAIIVNGLPSESDLCYEDFKKALMEQINYFYENSDLLTNDNAGSYSLGKYSESGSESTANEESIKRLSPMAYNILLACGLLYQGLGGC